MPQSLEAVGRRGEISLIGMLAEKASVAVNPLLLVSKGASLRGVAVGSQAMARRLHDAIDANGIKPAIDQVFPFLEAREAYRYHSSGAHFGKVVVTID